MAHDETNREPTMHHHHPASGASLSRLFAAGVLGCLFAFPVAAAIGTAPNLLSNSGFETGDLSGWTQIGDTGFTFANCGFLSSEGNCAAALGSTGTGTLAQVVSLTVGTPYELRLSLLGYNDNPSSFGAFLNGIELFTINRPSTAGAFQLYQATITATTGTGQLELRFTDPTGFMWLDNVQLAAVPEPAQGVLLTLGLAGLCVARRRGS
jgi:hypothetical protein